MTGYKSKRAAAQDKLLDDDDALTIAYQSGYYDGKKAAQRPWVGLTDEEQRKIAYNVKTFFDWGELMEATEATLRSKNT